MQVVFSSLFAIIKGEKEQEKITLVSFLPPSYPLTALHLTFLIDLGTGKIRPDPIKSTQLANCKVSNLFHLVSTWYSKESLCFSCFENSFN
jgi:hypothetical protein